MPVTCVVHGVYLPRKLVFLMYGTAVKQTCVLPLPFVFVVTVPARLNLVATSNVCRAKLCVIESYALVFLQT